MLKLPLRTWVRHAAIFSARHGAVAADPRVAHVRQHGVDARGPAVPARAAWRKATAALQLVEHLGGAWRRARAALEVFRPDGLLNDRAWAEARTTPRSIMSYFMSI